MINLSKRIILTTTVATSLVVLVSGLSVGVAALAYAQRSVDDRLHSDLEFLESVLARPSIESPEHRPPPPVEHGRGGIMDYFQILREDNGLEIARTPTLLPHDTLIPLIESFPTDYIKTGSLSGHMVRVIRHLSSSVKLNLSNIPIWLRSDHFDSIVKDLNVKNCGLIIYMAEDASAFQQNLRQLAYGLLAIWFVGTLLGTLAALHLRHAILGPIRRISSYITALDPEKLDTPFESSIPDEMRDIIKRLDHFRGEINAFILRERTTIANIAHELRTPIAGLKTTLEFARAAGGEPEQIYHECLIITSSMERIISHLLLLARLESKQLKPQFEIIDIEVVARSCWNRFVNQAATREISISWTLNGMTLLNNSEDMMNIVFSNIFDNIVNYSRINSHVIIEFKNENSQIFVRTNNSIEGPMPDMTRIFEPFWRSDSARSETGHTGLGLTLVQRIVTLCHGTISASILDNQFILEVIFKAS